MNNLYVVAGPIYQGETVRLGGAVMVPAKLYKAVYDPQRKEAGAYLIDNAAGAQAQMVNMAELEDITGIDIFPFLSHPQKDRGINLPEPKSYKERMRKGGR